MALEIGTIVTVITKLAPGLYERTMKAFHSAALKPSEDQAALLNEYLHQFNMRRAFKADVRDDALDPVIASVDELRQASHNYIAKLHTYPRGQVMVEAIVVSCQRFLDKWAVHRGKNYNVTYDGGPTGPKEAVPPGPRRAAALYEAFALDLLQLRGEVNLLRAGIVDIIREGAPAWGGWVVGDIVPPILEATFK